MVKHPLSISLGNRPRSGSVEVCPTCHIEYYLRPSSKRSINYCSRECSHIGQIKGDNLICKVCGGEYYQPPSQIKWRGSSFCSRECMGNDMSQRQKGENNPSWSGGVSNEEHRIRQSKDFKQWRRAVFERDDYTCQECLKRGSYLEPHHLKPFAYFPELRFDINNGRTLCQPCHRDTDTWGGKARRIYAKI